MFPASPLGNFGGQAAALEKSSNNTTHERRTDLPIAGKHAHSTHAHTCHPRDRSDTPHAANGATTDFADLVTLLVLLQQQVYMADASCMHVSCAVACGV